MQPLAEVVDSGGVAHSSEDLTSFFGPLGCLIVASGQEFGSPLLISMPPKFVAPCYRPAQRPSDHSTPLLVIAYMILVVSKHLFAQLLITLSAILAVPSFVVIFA